MRYGKTVKVSGVLTDLDGNDRDVQQYDARLTYSQQLNAPCFELVDGPTGFESFVVGITTVKDLADKGWVANNGTRGRWDRLFIPGAEMRKAFEELGVSV